jgi:hypothetical protein
LTWLEPVVATIIWNQLQSTKLLKISHRNDGHTSAINTDIGFQKMAALKVKATPEENIVLEISAHYVQCLVRYLFQDLRR